MPAGYTLDKNNVPYKKETGYYTVANVKGNNVRDGYSTNSRITGVLPITQRSNMTAHIALMAIDGLLILLIVDNVVI
ncbi:amidase [Staphylococcus aureus]|nr:amidase [Staphylococcus aureus]